MPELVSEPTRVPVPGGKTIDEFVGHVSTGTGGVSVAMMQAPAGWSEPFQVPDFDEVTLVLVGAVHVEHGDGEVLEVRAGQAVLTRAGERVRYSAPMGADYVAVCSPAFEPAAAHRESEPEGEGAAGEGAS